MRKTRPCKIKADGCEGRLTVSPSHPLRNWCNNHECMVQHGLKTVWKQKVARARLEAKKAKAAKVERCKLTLAQKQAQKRISTLKAEAQTPFNLFIRLRDADEPCICCGKPPGDGGHLTGGYWDAGHYLSRGARDHLRYNEDNVFKVCKRCNKDLSGNVAEMRIGMVARIGEARVIALEQTPAPARTWTREELESIKIKYRQAAKELKPSLLAGRYTPDCQFCIAKKTLVSKGKLPDNIKLIKPEIRTNIDNFISNGVV